MYSIHLHSKFFFYEELHRLRSTITRLSHSCFIFASCFFFLPFPRPFDFLPPACPCALGMRWPLIVLTCVTCPLYKLCLPSFLWFGCLLFRLGRFFMSVSGSVSVLFPFYICRLVFLLVIYPRGNICSARIAKTDLVFSFQNLRLSLVLFGCWPHDYLRSQSVPGCTPRDPECSQREVEKMDGWMDK